MIGFYDYTVILTYCGLVSSLVGIFFTVNQSFEAAIICLGISLICDTLDGKVARHKPNRSAKESSFGVQIDSLCDIVSFGVFPAVLCYMLGADRKLDLLLIISYCLCCVIRLGYFNVLALDASEEKGVYHGLPVVCMAIFMPLVYLLLSFIPDIAGLWLLRGVLIMFGLLYILDFPVKKPRMAFLIVLCVVFWVPAAAAVVI